MTERRQKTRQGVKAEEPYAERERDVPEIIGNGCNSVMIIMRTTCMQTSMETYGMSTFKKSYPLTLLEHIVT